MKNKKSNEESKYVIKVKITDANIKLARKRSVKIGANSKKISSGGELYGILGEQLFLDNYGGQLIDCKDYDILHEKIGKIDVKTKRCSSQPKDEYTCTVAAYQIDKKECEYYVFYRVLNNLTTAWFLGIISKKEFLTKAVKLKKGDNDGAFTVKADCYNIKISDLRNISEVLK